MKKKYKSFPVYDSRREILNALENNSVIIVESPTGSGKTIGIPIVLYENGYTGINKIAVTQPRRIAALNVCSFIKDQLDIKDETVACKIRFFDESTQNTKIKIMTDGILLEELKHDPLLESYSVVMIDEAHERSLNIDFILGLLKNVLEKRNDLKVIISSATINTKLFSEYFDNAPIILIEGKSYPVDVIYEPLEGTLTNSERDEVLIEKITSLVHNNIKVGDILVFLPGERLIKKTCSRLNYVLSNENVIIYPLFSRLSKEDQLKVFIPTKKNQTKIVVSTNIAETSITIDGIKVVIDSGLVKINYFNQNNFTQTLIEQKITKSNAEQRKGRAGRVSQGVCYRLYSQESFNQMQLYPQAEIVNSDLSEVVLRMLDLGIRDVESFPFISNVQEGNIASAFHTLEILDAVEGDRQLSSIGRFMAYFPLPVRFARILAEGVFKYPGALSNLLTILSFLSTKSPFIHSDEGTEISRKKHKKFENELGDFVALLELYEYYMSFHGDTAAQDKWCDDMYLDKTTMQEIYSIRCQLEEMLSEKQIPVLDDCSEKEYLMCIVSGLRQFVCKKIGEKEYTSAFSPNIYISSFSLYKPPKGGLAQYIVASEIVKTNRSYAHLVSPLIENWIHHLGIDFPKYSYKKSKPSKKHFQEKKSTHIEHIKNPKFKKKKKNNSKKSKKKHNR